MQHRLKLWPVHRCSAGGKGGEKCHNTGQQSGSLPTVAPLGDEISMQSINPKKSSLTAISPAMLRGTDVTKGLEEKVGWISTTFRPDPPPHPNLSGCPLSVRPLSPARWSLRTGSSNKSPGRLDAVQQHGHVLLIDYRHWSMMHRVTFVSLLLAGGGALFSAHHATGILHWSYSRPAPLQLIQCRTVKTELNLKEGKQEQAFLCGFFVCFYPRSDDERCSRGCMSGWWVCGCSTVGTSL